MAEGRADRIRGVQLAELALESLEVTEQVSGGDLGVLRAQGLAWVGNARRLAFDFSGAEKAFLAAEANLPEEEVEPLIVAEFYELKAALRWWQRSFAEALALSRRALSLFRSGGSPRQLAESLILRAEIHHHSGSPEAAIPYLEEALELTKDLAANHLKLTIRYNLVASYAKSGFYLQAAELLPAVKQHCDPTAGQDTACHVQWLEGFVNQGLGKLYSAEKDFLEARQSFIEIKQIGYAALVAVDLAVLYSEQGRHSLIPPILLEAIPVFECLKSEREAVAAVELLRNAIRKDEFSPVLLKNIRDNLEQVRLNPAARFVAETSQMWEPT